MDSPSGTAGQNHHTHFAPFAQHPGIPSLASALLLSPGGATSIALDGLDWWGAKEELSSASYILAMLSRLELTSQCASSYPSCTRFKSLNSGGINEVLIIRCRPLATATLNLLSREKLHNIYIVCNELLCVMFFFMWKSFWFENTIKPPNCVDLVEVGHLWCTC